MIFFTWKLWNAHILDRIASEFISTVVTRGVEIRDALVEQITLQYLADTYRQSPISEDRSCIEVSGDFEDKLTVLAIRLVVYLMEINKYWMVSLDYNWQLGRYSLNVISSPPPIR